MYFHLVDYNKSLCVHSSYFKCKDLAQMKFPNTLQSTSIKSKAHHLGPTAFEPPHWFPPLHPATGDETDSCHISAQLDGVFIITTQQGSDRGRKQQRERWRSGGSNGGGRGIKAGRTGGEREEGGRREGGRTNRRREGVGCCEVPRERTVPWLPRCLSVFFSLRMHVCVSVCVLVLTLPTQGEGVDNKK